MLGKHHPDCGQNATLPKPVPVEQQAQAVELHGGHGEDLGDAHLDCEEGEQPPAYVGLEFRKN